MRGILFFLLTLIVFEPLCLANHFWHGKTMTIAQAETRWGHNEFTAAKFKDADTKTRAKMVTSLMKNKKDWIGKSLKDVRNKLGGHDGYYFTDFIPAYLVEIGEESIKETWQVVFLTNDKYKIDDIIIHQN